MDYWRKEQIGAAMGVVAVVLMGVAALVGGRFPEPTATPQQIVAFIGDHRIRLLWEVYLFGAGGVFALWFMGSVRAMLRRAEGGSGRISAVAFGAGIGVLAGSFVSSLLLAGSAYRIADEVDPTITAALFHLATGAFVLTCFPIALFIGSITLVIMRTDVLPRAVAYLGALAVGVASAGTLAMFYESGSLSVGSKFAFYAPLGAALIFTLVASVTMVPALAKPENISHMRRRVSDIWQGGEARAAER